MENTNMIPRKILCYAGYLVSIILYVLMFTCNINKGTQAAFCLFASCLFSVCTILSFHNKQMQSNKDYSDEVNNRKNRMLKYKAGYITEIINMPLIFIIVIVCIIKSALLPAILISIVLVLQPIIIVLVSSYIERKN